MNDHSDAARELFERGYNCAQSVFAAFSDEIGLDMETALRLSSSFGGGMGRLREVCGAASAMFMLAGLKFGYAGPGDADAKAAHYRLIQSLGMEFKERNGSFICRELLGLPEGADEPAPSARTPEYYQSRPCAGLVACAAGMVDELLKKRCGAEEARTGE